MRHGEARFGPDLIRRGGFARALGLPNRSCSRGSPICTGSTGNTFLYIPLRDREVVDRHGSTWARAAGRPGRGAESGRSSSSHPILTPKLAGSTPACRPHTSGRSRGPGHRLGERAVGAYLVEHGLVTPAATVDIVSEQGTRMGRPSFIRIRVGMSAGPRQRDPVGGSVVPVIEGRIRVPYAIVHPQAVPDHRHRWCQR